VSSPPTAAKGKRKFGLHPFYFVNDIHYNY
jgi:hypothetical protein